MSVSRVDESARGSLNQGEFDLVKISSWNGCMPALHEQDQLFLLFLCRSCDALAHLWMVIQLRKSHSDKELWPFYCKKLV